MTRLSEQQMVWRCRRGVRELDVLFERFRLDAYPHLNTTEQAAFHRLLDQQDPIIMDWLFGRTQSEDAGMQAIVAQLAKLSGL